MDSNILRWLLLIVAAIVLFAWFISHLLSTRRQGKSLRAESHEPETHMAEHSSDPLMVQESGSLEKPPEVIPDSDNLVIIAVDCKNAQEFNGATVLELLVARGLEEGQYSIYHRNIQSDGNKRLVYSVINGIEPGYMNDDFAQTTTPSIMFFINLEQSYNPLKAFSEMLESAQNLASQLSGSVCDSDHSSLTEQTIAYVRESIREKERSKHLQANH